MKKFKYFLSAIIITLGIISCVDEIEENIDFVSTANSPTNVTALFTPTTDNSGLVTITPNSEGANSYSIIFGDETTDPVSVKQGGSTNHVYAEGTYQVKIIAIGITGLKTEVTKELVVSFNAPIIDEVGDVIIEVDGTTSYGVFVTVDNVDYGISYEVFFGEPGNDVSVLANVGDKVSYIYQEGGIYTIRVVVSGAAIETAEYTEDFEALKIAAPIVKAPIPGNFPIDVKSIYSDVWNDPNDPVMVAANVSVSEWNPDWGGQSTVLSTFVVEDDNVLKYDYFSYSGIVTNYDNPTDISNMEYVHFDYWTNDATSFGFKIVNTAYGDGDPLKESEVVTPISTFGEWVSVDIPLSEFTSDISSFSQLVLSSTGETVFVDNIYFWKEPSEQHPLVGTWKIAPEEGALGVGPAVGDYSWWFLNKDGKDDVTERACLLDDEYIFNADGTFNNVLGTETWLEPWQGFAPEQCGAPIAPHDGSNPATWDSTASTITLSGLGAYLGLAKVHNGGEDGAPVDNTIIYNYELSADGNTLELVVDLGWGFWYFKMIKEQHPLVGTWKIAPEEGALGVGPAVGDYSWWFLNKDGKDDVTERACLLDDEYIFNADGTFNNVLGTETWLEPWQGFAPEQCGAPIAPHDGSNPATWDSTASTITLSGLGAYLGLAKVHNGGEDGAPVDNTIIYNYELSADGNTLELVVDLGWGFWYFKMIK